MSEPPLIHLLLVEGDKSLQRLLADALRAQGFQVGVEAGGEWARRAFQQRPAEVVLLDGMAAAPDGDGVAQRLRELPGGPQAKIVLLGGPGSRVPPEALRERCGADAFLQKPFKLGDLYALLAAQLGERYPTPRTGLVEESQPTDGEALASADAEAESSAVEAATHSPGMGTLRGTFPSRSFPELLAELYRWRADGALLLRRDKVKKIVFFREGRPQLVKSNLMSECLGRVMVSERMISQANCEESLRRMKASRLQQGTVLVQMGCISPQNLSYALNLQQRVKLFEVFAWESGEFRFDPKMAPPSEALALELSTAAAIHEGVRRTFDAQRLARVLPSAGAAYVHPSPDPLYALQDLDLSEEEQLLLEEVDGQRTVADLRALALLPPLDTDRLVYALGCAQLLELRPTPSASPTRPLFARAGRGAASVDIDLSDDWEGAAEPPTFQPEELGAEEPPVAGTPMDETPVDEAPFEEVPAAQKPGAEELGPEAIEEIDAMDVLGPIDSSRSLPVVAEELPGPPVPPEHPAPGLFPDLSGPHRIPELDDGLVRERLASRVALTREQDHFELLGVGREASADRVREAYLPLAREYHPDRAFDSSSAEVRALAQELYDLTTAAYETLIDPQARATYVDQLRDGEGQAVREDVGRLIDAEERFQQGEERLRDGAFAEAHRLFEEAVGLYGDEAEFHAYLGWARFQMAPSDAQAAQQALAALERAVSLSPRNDRAHLFTGYVHKALGRTELAEKSFERAAQSNPACSEALQELSILGWAARLGGRKS